MTATPGTFAERLLATARAARIDATVRLAAVQARMTRNPTHAAELGQFAAEYRSVIQDLDDVIALAELLDAHA